MKILINTPFSLYLNYPLYILLRERKNEHIQKSFRSVAAHIALFHSFHRLHTGKDFLINIIFVVLLPRSKFA